MPRRAIEYRVVLRPSVDKLIVPERVMIGVAQMAAFLGVSRMNVYKLIGTDRIPSPIRLGLGNCVRWSVFELLEWVEAGCPRRADWIEQRGWSGWARNHASRW